jgi:methionyl-tRNA formyltransferase
MKVLVVTSEVTFVPQNYNSFIETLLNELNNHDGLEIEIAILKNNSPQLMFKAIALMIAGATQTGFCLLKNCMNLPRTRKEQLLFKYNKKPHFFINPNHQDFIEFVKSEKFDLIVNARTRFIYKKNILLTPRLGCINIHHGLLPEYRGTMCDLWALFENRPTGFTIHKMEKKIDDGFILEKIETTSNVNGFDQQLRRSFLSLIFKSSIIEGKTLAKLLKDINNSSQLPKKIENNISKPIYSKNPTFLMIRKIKELGIQL